MTEDHDQDVQNWFNRSVEETPHQPFAFEVLATVRRKERYWQLQRYAAWLAALSGICLLGWEFIAPLNMLASLPSIVTEIGGEQWPLLVVTTIGIAYWLIKQARNTDFLRRIMLAL